MRRLQTRIVAPVLISLVVSAAAPVLVNADCDNAAPVLTAVSLDRTSVDASAGPTTVTCSMGVSDAPAGVRSAECRVFYESGLIYQKQSCTATSPATGSTQSGTFRCPITIPRYSANGNWTMHVTLKDATGNFLTYDPTIFPAGSTTALSVTTSDEDTIPPTVVSATLVPGTVDASAGSRIVTCNMNLTDAKSGIDFTLCLISSPSPVSQTLGCGVSNPVTGTRTSGVFSCDITIPRYSDNAAWTTSVRAYDLASNLTPDAPLPGLNVASSPEDVVPPVITQFILSPGSVNVGSDPATVACTLDLTDALSGVDNVVCNFVFFDGHKFVPASDCTATAPVSGSRNNGRFSCNAVIPAHASEGAWPPQGTTYWFVSASATDVAKNMAISGASPGLSVSSCADAAQANQRFENRTTLVWDGVPGATRYNVYRAPLTALVDSNGDGIPDGGYGTCQNSRDPNLTDTQFIDSDVPTTAQKGFFYLVSYLSGGTEFGLGNSTDGGPRFIGAPCP